MMSESIIKILTDVKNSPFDEYYESARSYFDANGHFHQLSGNTCFDRKKWPKNPGVYVVWKISHEMVEVVYIGMTGKFSSSGQLPDNEGLRGRLVRWTPYCFDRTKKHFSFAPNYQKGESRRLPPKNGYATSIPIAEIRVDCFEYEKNKKMAPSFLEALLLQGYLMQYKNLPDGNNAF